MNRTNQENINTYIKICWVNRKLVTYIIALSFFIGIVLSFVSNKNFTAESTLVITKPAELNPFLHDAYSTKGIEKRNQAIESILTSHQVLNHIASKSGLFTDKMTQADKDNVFDKLVKYLSAKMIGSDIIKISYTSSDKEKIIPVVKVTTKILGHYLQPALSQLGTNRLQASNEVSALDRQIANATAALANAQARYSPRHSEIISLNRQLQKLHAKRNKLVLFSPALAQNTQQAALPVGSKTTVKSIANSPYDAISVKVLSIDSYPVTNWPLSMYLVFYTLASLGLGLVLIIGIILLTELFDSSIQRRQQLKTITEKPVIARLPKYSSI